MAGGQDFPTRTEIRKARKAKLQAWAREYGLDDVGLVADLRERLLAHIEEGGDAVEFEEDMEISEERVYAARAKPVLSEGTQALLVERATRRAHRPAFRRQEWFRYKRLGRAWRRPRGHHSKLRRHLGYRPAMPSTGHRGPRGVRGLHPSGFQEVLIHRPADLEGLNPEVQAARIAHSVGTRKRVSIQERADELGVRILNRVVE
ncbi:MAG: 50S ribosomal protein L32e [Candidatus Thermoplasmatota archaeon]|nr:50S ribosomal protein L32e [Candidatus Thermoplasmatota archaeon]